MQRLTKDGLTKVARGASRALITDSGSLNPPVLWVGNLKFLRKR